MHYAIDTLHRVSLVSPLSAIAVVPSSSSSATAEQILILPRMLPFSSLSCRQRLPIHFIRFLSFVLCCRIRCRWGPILLHRITVVRLCWCNRLLCSCCSTGQNDSAVSCSITAHNSSRSTRFDYFLLLEKRKRGWTLKDNVKIVYIDPGDTGSTRPVCLRTTFATSFYIKQLNSQEKIETN